VLALSTGGEILAATDQENAIHIFDAKRGQFLRRFPDRSGQSVLRSPGEPPGIMALNHDGSILALPKRMRNSAEIQVVLFDPRSGVELDHLPLGLSDVFAITFSRDGERLAVSDGETIECYERTTKKLIRRIDLGDMQRAFMQRNSSPRVKAHYSQVALSPDGMMLSASGSPMSDQILLWNLAEEGSPRAIGTSDSRLASVGIFTLGLALWAAAWGIVRKRDRIRSGFQPMNQTKLTPFWPRLLVGGCWLGVATILFVELRADDTFRQRELYVWLMSTQGYFSSLHLIALVSLPCLFLLLMFLTKNRTNATLTAAAGLDSTSSVQMQPRSSPWGLRLCWLLMVVGGLVALLVPVSAILFGRSGMPWTNFVSLFVGIVTISRAGSRDTLGLLGVVRLQAINIIACDFLNFAFAAIEFSLLRRPRVKQFLEQADRG
jgi:hypothetical protein